MRLTQKLVQPNVLKRTLWAFMIFYLVPTLSAFAIGYFFLPEGFLRGGPTPTPAEFVAQQEGFWSQFLSTIGFNLGFILLIGVGCNTQSVRKLPLGYLYVLIQAIMMGIVAGTNSFVVQAISPYALE